MSKSRATGTKAAREPNLVLATPESLQQQLNPQRLTTRHALLFHMDNHRLAALTFHPIGSRNHGGAPEIMPGRILTPADEAKILKLLTAPRQRGALDLVPDGTLVAEDDHSMWWIPSHVRPMTLFHKGEYITREACWPTLVLLAYNRSIHLAALPEPTRPDPATPLFHAPLGNVYARNGEVCLGDCAPAQTCQFTDIPEWNRIIFESAFSHTNHPHAMTGQDTMSFWARKRKKPRPVPVSALTPMNTTLAQWYEQVVQGA